MLIRTTNLVLIAAIVVCAGFVPRSEAATVWTGPEVGFLKLGSDPVSVQDVLTAEVSLTRGASGFLFNPLGGDGAAGPGTPSGTRWAFDTAIGNPDGAVFGAANHAALTFAPFLDAVGGTNSSGGAGVPNVVLANPGVLHLVAADAYLDIRFLQWTSPFATPGAAVEYVRSSPVPLPAALPLLLASLVPLARHHRRDGRATPHRTAP